MSWMLVHEPPIFILVKCFLNAISLILFCFYFENWINKWFKLNSWFTLRAQINWIVQRREGEGEMVAGFSFSSSVHDEASQKIYWTRIHNDPRRTKVKYHEFWQLHWQRSWAQSERPDCVCVAGSWKFELVCLSLSDTDSGCAQDPGSLSQSHTWSRSERGKLAPDGRTLAFLISWYPILTEPNRHKLGF